MRGGDAGGTTIAIAIGWWEVHCQSIVVTVAAWHNVGSSSKMIMNAREGAGENRTSGIKNQPVVVTLASTPVQKTSNLRLLKALVCQLIRQIKTIKSCV